MTESPPRSNSDGDTGTPRWAKVFGIISLGVVLLFVIMLIAGGGRHGPGRHTQPTGEARRVQQP